MVNEYYKEYLLYLVGNLKEGKIKNYPNNRFWSGDKIGTVFELESDNRFWIQTPILNGFCNFFGLSYSETRLELKLIIEDLLNLNNLIVLSSAHLTLSKFNENIEIIE